VVATIVVSIRLGERGGARDRERSGRDGGNDLPD
jgi:hypothetical protein